MNILPKLVSLLQAEWLNGDVTVLFRSSSHRLCLCRKTQLSQEGKSTGFYQLLAENSEIQPVSAGVINGKDNLFQNLSSKICSGCFPAKFHNRISDWNPTLIFAYNLSHLEAGKSLFLRHSQKINDVMFTSEVFYLPALSHPCEHIEVSCSLWPSQADVPWYYWTLGLLTFAVN